MRKERVDAINAEEAYNQCPWAWLCIKVEGGFMCFESQDDYLIWRNQI